MQPHLFKEKERMKNRAAMGRPTQGLAVRDPKAAPTLVETAPRMA